MPWHLGLSLLAVWVLTFLLTVRGMEGFGKVGVLELIEYGGEAACVLLDVTSHVHIQTERQINC